MGHRTKSQQTAWQCPLEEETQGPREGPWPEGGFTLRIAPLVPYLDHGAMENRFSSTEHLTTNGPTSVFSCPGSASGSRNAAHPALSICRQRRHRYIHPGKGVPGWAGRGARGEPKILLPAGRPSPGLIVHSPEFTEEKADKYKVSEHKRRVSSLAGCRGR